MYGVHRTCAETATVSCGSSHASAVSTPLRWIFENALYKASHSCRITCERSESARERRIALYKSNHHHHHHYHQCSLFSGPITKSYIALYCIAFHCIVSILNLEVHVRSLVEIRFTKLKSLQGNNAAVGDLDLDLVDLVGERGGCRMAG